MKRQRRHDLHHDQLGDTLGGVWRQILAHRARVLLVIVALALFAGLITWYYTTALAEEREANWRLSKVEEATERIERLRLSRAAQTGKAISEIAGNAIKICRSVARDFPSSPVAARAMLRAGQLLFDESKVDEAVDAFRKTIPMAADRPMLQRMARSHLGVALEQAGKPFQAMRQYQQLAKSPYPLARARAYWDIGRCHEDLTEINKARQSYALARESAPNSIWAEQAAYRMRAITEVRPSPAKPDAAKSAAPGKQTPKKKEAAGARAKPDAKAEERAPGPADKKPAATAAAKPKTGAAAEQDTKGPAKTSQGKPEDTKSEATTAGKPTAKQPDTKSAATLDTKSGGEPDKKSGG